MHMERNVDPATPDPTAKHQHAADAQSEAQESLAPEAASHQVVVGDIPVEPPGFRPRSSLLAELDRAGARVSLIRASTGLHGLGATQLAAAYARAKLEAGWRLVAWVDGADTGSLLAGLAAVAEATGLTDDDSGRGITDLATTVRHWLETDGDRCLLVFDNVPDPEVLQEFVPAHGTARVLITSTRQAAAKLGSTVTVNVFNPAEASAFLAGRTGLDDEAGAAAVAAELGHLPLALALAAPVIMGQHIGYARYLDRLQATPAEVSLTGNDRRPYPVSLARTVRLSLQVVRTADRTGACTRVMEIMAVLSAAGVRRELLYTAGQAGVLASGRRRVAAGHVDRVLEWLSDRSLLTFSLDGQTVILHRLVAQVIRDELDRRQMLTEVCEVAAFVLDAYSQALVGSADRRAIRGIPQQVTALLDSLIAPATEVGEELAWLLLQLRFAAFYHLLELGDSMPQAIAAGEPLAQDLERLVGHDHPDTLNARNSLAAVYLTAGRVAEAISLFEQTLAVRQRVLGSDDPDTLTSQNNLASAYQDAGRIAEAIPLLEQTLEVRQRLVSPDHPAALNSRGNLAAAYLAAGRVTEAIPLLEQTLAGREQVLGPDHPDTRTSRKNLANAYRTAGRIGEAIPLEQIMAGRQQMLRRDHPDTQVSRKNPATTCSDGGQATKEVLAVEQTSADRERKALADADTEVLPASLNRPPADPAEPPPSDRAVVSSAELFDHSFPSRTQDSPPTDAEHDRRVVMAITAGESAGIAMAYDRYAAVLYGYCHWMLHDSAGAAECLQDTFVLTASTLSDLPEPAKLRPWLFALARNECRRRIRPRSATRDEADAANQRANATDGLADVNDYPGQAELRALVRSILADLKPREREVIELSFWHDMDDDDLASVLGVSRSRAHTLASRASGRLKKSFGAMRTALDGRETCPVLRELLADWDGQPTEQTLDLVVGHTEQCQTCANHARDALRPTVLSGLLPLAPLPPELRQKILSRCISTSQEAVAYRRQVVRRAESTWAAIFSQVIRRVSWGSIRANPGAATAAMSFSVWVTAAVSVTLLTFAGSHAAHARAPQPTAGNSSSGPATPALAGGRASAGATSAPAAGRPAAPGPSTAQPSPSHSLTPSPTLSRSPQASRSPSRSPSPSHSPSPSPSPSPQPSPSPSGTPSPSPTP
jgi:RNA polymerase sigma factor (sigma-70 family)